MTKKTIIIPALSIVALLAMAAMSFAGPGYNQGRGGCGYANGGFAFYDNLTPEKQKAVDVIVDKYRTQQQDLRDQLWAKQATLEAMINGGNADEAKITKLIGQMRDIRTKMGANRDAMRAELEKETGIVLPNRGCGRGGFGPGTCYDNDGQGRGQGNGQRW
ncbi:Spy/CpxP family protein refolding chaperone [Salidesulfovibrio onnuriiensis]|uniref:Spy/CpxP family protein refolding chaperone n=1 Tax=Salidesulfovibrio onnuriiensis TaxID=2583823 RepID=UPI00164FFAE0|nr:Spy/CpxP family protein refolding chaperone [Salidesulfovibrio onnuriiensis]